MNWIQLIRGSQAKHRKLWKASKAKPCLGVMSTHQTLNVIIIVHLLL